MWKSGLAKLWRREVDASSPRYRNLEDDGAFGANLYRQNMIERHRNPRTRETNVRTLIVGLDDDTYVSPAVMKSGLSHADPGYFVRLPFDHWSIFEAPDQLANFVADWVDQAAPPVTSHR
jgi:pimeloyl-ACP methyl ester carboxylesterase